MTYIMSGGALNSTHSLECDLISAVISYRSLWCDVGNVSVCDEIVKAWIKRKYEKNQRNLFAQISIKNGSATKFLCVAAVN